MNVYSSLAEAKAALQRPSLAIGNFDGVHVGHQALFAAAREHAHPRQAAAAALTFEPHPAQVLAPEVAPPRLTSLAVKLELMARAGLDAVIVQPFTRDFASLEPEAFASSLFDMVGARQVVVGFDFTYGRQRGGGVDSLRSEGASRGAEVTVVPKVTVDGLPASSTKVRELLLEGKVEAAARLLNHRYSLEGQVIHGQARGRTIGFPTANLAVGSELVPAPGVYATLAKAGERWWPAAANIGRKPTFGAEESPTIELHLLGFSGDLYGEHLQALFVERLRGEQRFAGVDALKEQIGRDVERTRRVAATTHPLSLDPSGALTQGTTPPA